MVRRKCRTYEHGATHFAWQIAMCGRIMLAVTVMWAANDPAGFGPLCVLQG